MAKLPANIVTKTLTISPAATVGRVMSSLEVFVEPTNKVVYWQPTAEPVSDFFDLMRTGPDQSAVVVLPAVDQPGFVDTNQQPITDWTYTIIVRYLRDGRKVGQKTTKYFKPTLGSLDIQDFDTIPDGDVPVYQGPPGPQGLSAYQIAVNHGFEGTELEWLASLATGGYVPSHTHYQMSPENEWVIEHNLGYFPGGVSVVTSAHQQVNTEVSYIDLNTIKVSMSGAMSGTAYIS
jgi:hypothetical protein